jgi:hypothetical protein
MERENRAREGRLRRMAARQGLFLAKSRHRRSFALGRGGYILFSDSTRAVAVLGATDNERGPWDVNSSGYQATLDEIEAYLVRGERS